MIGLVTDSNAQLPPELATRYGVEVVPLTVTVDGEAFAEGVDLDADAFYARFDHGTPTVSTSQPSPGAFAEAYARVAERGATEILSIHIGSAVSGTLNSARIAVAGSPVPVRLVDTGTASFGVACCVWEAASRVAARRLGGRGGSNRRDAGRIDRQRVRGEGTRPGPGRVAGSASSSTWTRTWTPSPSCR